MVLSPHPHSGLFCFVSLAIGHRGSPALLPEPTPRQLSHNGTLPGRRGDASRPDPEARREIRHRGWVVSASHGPSRPPPPPPPPRAAT
ncbi:hypothetical protein H8959_012709 [Pygathrix nigripes]